MPNLGDRIDDSTTNWTRTDDAGDGRWWREEDIYNPMNFGTLLGDWQAPRDIHCPKRATSPPCWSRSLNAHRRTLR